VVMIVRVPASGQLPRCGLLDWTECPRRKEWALLGLNQ
jgi:hypothetical protein